MRRFVSMAESYRRNRATGARAVHAFQWAKAERATVAFWYRAEGVSKYKTSFCNEDGADVWEIESHSGAIRVEIAIMPDHDGGLDRDHGSDDYASFRRYFRDVEKLGKAEAHQRAVAAVKQQAEDNASDGNGTVCGVSVRVFYDVPRLEAGDPIGEDSLWGIEISNDADSEFYLWDCVLQVYREATHGLCGKIRQARKQALRDIMAEAFAANFAV